MTTNNKLTEILKVVPRFQGVYLYDQLDKIPHLQNGVIVINYVTSQEVLLGKVGHYVVVDNRQGLLKNDGWTGTYFFDPYGFGADVPRNIMGLPNTGNINRFLNRIQPNKHLIKSNDFDWQSEKPWDSLCGVYSALFTLNPNYRTNPVFYNRVDRQPLDHKLEQLFRELDVLGSPFHQIKRDSTKVLEDLSDSRLTNGKTN